MSGAMETGRQPQGAAPFEGVAWDPQKIPTESPAELVERHAREAPQAPCVEYLGVSLDYAEMDRWANRFANLLKSLGAERGDVIGLHLPNTPQYLIGLLGAFKLGCPASGVSPLLKADELSHQVDDAGIRFLVSLDRLFAEVGVANDGHLPGLKAALVTGPVDFLPWWKKTLARLTGKVAKPALPRLAHIPVVDYWPALRAASDARVCEPPELDDVVLIQYTGGTTGQPKGAELTLRNILANAAQSEAVVDYDVGGETFASAFPYFHAAGLGVALMSLRQRARVLVVPDPRDVAGFSELMQRFPPTLLANVPTLYQMLYDQPAFHRVDFSRLKMALSGAAPAPVELIQRLESVLGTGKFCESYGLTETSPMLTINPPGRIKPGTVGVPLPGTDIRIVDADAGETELPRDEPGELIVSGPQVFHGYRSLPEESARALRTFDGKTFFYTGDMASMDADGYITIRDRLKDMLIVGGYKVFSVEIENKLDELEEVERSAVIGRPDADRPGNDVVTLYVQPAEAARSQDEAALRERILAFCREHMAPYKVPKAVHLVDEIPLTPVGKLDKKALRG